MPGQSAQSIGQAGSSVAQFHGFGSHIQNPATPALINRSAASIGFASRNMEQESLYLGQWSNDQGGQYALTHAGYDHHGETSWRTISIGGGYTQTADYNRAFTVSGFNDLTSRTFQSLNDYSANAAYDAYALDEDGNADLRSIYEVGGFEGVNQFTRWTGQGHSGEYSAYIATEFVEDLFVGISGSIPVSNYSLSTILTERGGDYYSGENGTGTYNVDQVLYEERVDVSAQGVLGRIGIVYTGLDALDVGASYTTTTRWKVDEDRFTQIQTSFDGPVTLDGQELQQETVFESELEGRISYEVTSPARYQIGFATKESFGIPWMTLFATGEYIDYGRIDLSDFEAPDLDDERPVNGNSNNYLQGADYRQMQINENNTVADEFLSVWNFRGGVALTGHDTFEPRIGYSRIGNNLRSQRENVKQYVSAGLGIGVHERLVLDIGVRYGFWEESSDLYRVDAETDRVIVDGEAINFSETVRQDVQSIHGAIGLSVQL
ncbi:MAG: hypothetical protein WEA36_05905 [Balneolaceae bacterium]